MGWLIEIVIAALGFAGLALLATQIGRLRHTPEEAAQLIEAAAEGSATLGQWEAFLTVRQLDERVEEARLDCAEIADAHAAASRPPLGISPAGAVLLLEVAERLLQPE